MCFSSIRDAPSLPFDNAETTSILFQVAGNGKFSGSANQKHDNPTTHTKPTQPPRLLLWAIQLLPFQNWLSGRLVEAELQRCSFWGGEAIVGDEP
jgi:hypothetical protein